ncbi:UvrD-helicase domain-containing protein [Bacteroidota bacterium]
MNRLTPFQKDALNYSDHISLTANAGSGKTFVLTKRYVDIALKERIPLSSIIAITFTEKAASELYTRIVGEVEERIKTTGDLNTLDELKRIRHQLISAKISTIHSFCIDILKEYSPVLGLDANFKPIDQNTANEILEKSVDEFLNSKIYKNQLSDEVKYLIRILGSLKNFNNQVFNVTRHKKTFQKILEELYHKEKDDIKNYLYEKFEREYQIVFANIINDIRIFIGKINNWILEQNSGNELALKIKELLNKFDDSIDYHSEMDLLKQLNVLLFTVQGKIRSRKYLSKEARQKFSVEISDIQNFFHEIKFLLSAVYKKDVENELAIFSKTFALNCKEILEIFTNKKIGRRFLDFDDILLFSEKLLKIPSVQKDLSEKYKYIMIDEYQDTNEIQYKIFMPILNNLSSGNLFIVGDEKQSIYMFRDAELEIYNKTTKDILNSNVNNKLLKLPHSFRVSPQIALFVNKLFSTLFSDPNEKFNEVAHDNLICTRSNLDVGRVEFILAHKDQNDSESDLVANKILNLISKSERQEISLSDIAVLARKRDSFLDLEKMLIKLNIPYRLISGKGFYQKQIIYDVYNYLKFLVSPDQDYSLIAILRSPFYCISDKTLLKISLMGGISFLDKFELYNQTNHKFKKVLNLLRKHISVSKYMTLPELIDVIINDTNYWAVINSRSNPQQETKNLEKLISISNEFSLGSFKTLFDFVEYLSNSIKSIEDENQADVSPVHDYLRLMTIHQAKGLEFKVVILYKCNDIVESDTVKSKNIKLDKNFGILTKIPLNRNYFNNYIEPPIVGFYNYIMDRKNIAESKRLLYVGITRAIDELIISAEIKNKLNSGSFIEMIVNGLDININEDNYVLSGSLEFMDDEKNDHKIYLKDISYPIHITKKNYNQIGNSSFKDQKNEIFKEIYLDNVRDKIKNEIISATKVSVFIQCPIKYNFIYNLGYNEILKWFKKFEKQYEFNIKEDDEISRLADIKGQIIHSLLEKELFENEIEDNLNFMLEKIGLKENISRIQLEKIKLSVLETICSYKTSSIYDRIKSYHNYRNEFEIYFKEDDYILYGIIDKLLISEDKLIIVDYKTDYITDYNHRQKIDHYKPQLLFYAYLLSKSRFEIVDFEYIILFLDNTEKSYHSKISRFEIDEFGKKIKGIVNNIRSENFEKNKNHCSDCIFSLNHECINEFDINNS